MNTIRRHIEDSLRRLGTDYIDLYYLHRINPDIAIEKVTECMSTLISEKIIRGWGLSMVNADIIDKAQRVCPLSAVQNIYSVMDRDYEKEVIPYCEKHDIGFVAFSPTASGYVSGKVDLNTKFEGDDVRKWVPQMKRENMIANLPLLELLKGFAERKNATTTQIALAWILRKYKHAVPVPGSKNHERILENLGACNIDFTDNEFAELENGLNKIKIHGNRKEVKLPHEYID